MAARRRTFPLALLASIVLTMGLSAGTLATESNPTGDSHRVGGTGRFAPVDDAMRVDLTLIANEKGLSYEKAVEEFSWQNDFARIVEEARVRFPGSYVSAEIVRDGKNQAWITFTEIPEEWVENRLGGFPVFVEVRETSEAPTEIEQNEMVQSVHFAVLATAGVSDAASSIDPLTGHVEVEYSLAASGHAGDVQGAVEDAVRTSLESSPPSRRASPSVTVRERRDLGMGNEALSGGAQLMQNGANYCTAGFTVTRLGVKGILTAAHCLPPMSYGLSTPLTNQASTTGSNGDLRWLSTSEAITNLVYTSPTTTTTVTATGSPVAGMTLSFFGRSTGASTDEVYRLNECAGVYCSLTMMHRHRTSPGDSGGPWRSGHVAYGVHHGYKTYLLIERSLFTRVGLANTALGVAIKTSP